MSEFINTYEKPDEGCMDFEDAIESDGLEFIVLEEGDYPFTVTECERGHFSGGTVIPPCNKVTVTLRVETDSGVAVIRTDFLLHRKLEWRLSAFFRSIGLKKQGERMTMDWNKAVGAKGRAHIASKTYTDRYGKERETNEVVRFYDFEPKCFPEEDEEWMSVPEDAVDMPFN